MTEIMKVIHGSRAYGTDVEDSDTDLRSVFVASEGDVVGPWDYAGSIRSDNNGRDETAFELRKFLKLCASQNPNVLEMLFVPMDCMLEWTAEGSLLRAQAAKFLSKKISVTYAGFADSCVKRMTSGATGTGARKDGTMQYDYKYAMHAVRCLQTGIETLKTGWMNVRRENRGSLLAIRNGAYPLDHIISKVKELKNDLAAAHADSPLPDDVDREWVADLCVTLSKRVWSNGTWQPEHTGKWDQIPWEQ